MVVDARWSKNSRAVIMHMEKDGSRYLWIGLDPDALSQPGIKTLLVELGLNDLAGGKTAADVEAGLAQIVSRAHVTGVRVVGGTLPPAKGNAQWSAQAETYRQAVNSWIRTSNPFDATVDLDAAVASGDTLQAAYDCGDHVHQNTAGRQALAGAIPLSVL